MTKANQFAIENGIKFEAEKTSAKIDEIVALCKEVNVKSAPEKNRSSGGIAHKQKTIIR